MLNIDSFIYLYDRLSFACYMWPIKQNYTIDEQHIQKKIIYGDKSLKKVRIAISCLQLGQIFISYSNVQVESIFWYKNAFIHIELNVVGIYVLHISTYVQHNVSMRIFFPQSLLCRPGSQSKNPFIHIHFHIEFKDTFPL